MAAFRVPFYRAGLCCTQAQSRQAPRLFYRVDPQRSSRGSLPSLGRGLGRFYRQGSVWTRYQCSWRGCQGISKLQRRRRLVSSQVRQVHLVSSHQLDIFCHTCMHVSSSNSDFNRTAVIPIQVRLYKQLFKFYRIIYGHAGMPSLSVQYVRKVFVETSGLSPIAHDEVCASIAGTVASSILT